MTVFTVGFSLRDSYKRKTRKTYYTEDITGADVGAEFLAAQTAAGDLATDLAALSEMEILYYNVGLKTVYSDTADADANVDEGVTFTVEKADNEDATVKVPAPIPGIFNVDGTVDMTNAAVTAFLSNFQAGGSFTISDGEKAVNLVKGRLDK